MQLIDLPHNEQWKRNRRPMLFVLSADLSPQIIKRVEQEGFVKSFSLMTNSAIQEIYEAVMDRNLKLQQMAGQIGLIH
jgi:ribosomal protein S8